MAGILKRLRQRAVNKAVKIRANFLADRYEKDQEMREKIGPVGRRAIDAVHQAEDKFRDLLSPEFKLKWDEGRFSSDELLSAIPKERKDYYVRILDALIEFVDARERVKGLYYRSKALSKKMGKTTQSMQRPRSGGLVGRLRFLTASPSARKRVKQLRKRKTGLQKPVK
ncbi:MAG: hypothetical protein Q7K34_01880 [archaeon]|nr:hypothetical protein [archaeon]